jgi:hypothetical protein
MKLAGAGSESVNATQKPCKRRRNELISLAVAAQIMVWSSIRTLKVDGCNTALARGDTGSSWLGRSAEGAMGGVPQPPMPPPNHLAFPLLTKTRFSSRYNALSR